MDTKLDFSNLNLSILSCTLTERHIIHFAWNFSKHDTSLFRLHSFSNWRTARSILFDVTYSTPVSSLKLTSFSNWRTDDVTYSTDSFFPLLLPTNYRYIGVFLTSNGVIWHSTQRWYFFRNYVSIHWCDFHGRIKLVFFQNHDRAPYILRLKKW